MLTIQYTYIDIIIAVGPLLVTAKAKVLQETAHIIIYHMYE